MSGVQRSSIYSNKCPQCTWNIIKDNVKQSRAQHMVMQNELVHEWAQNGCAMVRPIKENVK